MKTEEEINAEIDSLYADERLHYPRASFGTNCVLAAEQIAGKARIQQLCWVIGRKMPLFHGDTPEKRTALG